MNTLSDPNLVLDKDGICNHCNKFDEIKKAEVSSIAKQQKFNEGIAKIKAHTNKLGYNCLLGVSGGVDSTYLAYLAKQESLKPLVVHFDNGWNSELSVKNIQSLCKKLNYDLHTYVIEWNEFKDIQLAYFKAGVIDIEAVTDHAIYATILKIAKQYNIKYILSGYNYATESVMPSSWVWNKSDWTNIQDIHAQFGTGSIKTFPRVSFWDKLINKFFYQIETLQLLNLIDYNKTEAKKLLVAELDWVDYGGKHYESVFTKFYQTYILPKKFGVDKRMAHYACLIQNGEMTREEALAELQKPIIDAAELKTEKEYVLKKLGVTDVQFEEWMHGKIVPHSFYKTEQVVYWNKYFKLIKILKTPFAIFKK